MTEAVVAGRAVEHSCGAERVSLRGGDRGECPRPQAGSRWSVSWSYSRCGAMVNADGLRDQVEGAVVQVSAARCSRR